MDERKLRLYNIDGSNQQLLSHWFISAAIKIIQLYLMFWFHALQAIFYLKIDFLCQFAYREMRCWPANMGIPTYSISPELHFSQ